MNVANHLSPKINIILDQLKNVQLSKSKNVLLAELLKALKSDSATRNTYKKLEVAHQKELQKVQQLKEEVYAWFEKSFTELFMLIKSKHKSPPAMVENIQQILTGDRLDLGASYWECLLEELKILIYYLADQAWSDHLKKYAVLDDNGEVREFIFPDCLQQLCDMHSKDQWEYELDTKGAMSLGELLCFRNCFEIACIDFSQNSSEIKKSMGLPERPSYMELDRLYWHFCMHYAFHKIKETESDRKDVWLIEEKINRFLLHFRKEKLSQKTGPEAKSEQSQRAKDWVCDNLRKHLLSFSEAKRNLFTNNEAFILLKKKAKKQKFDLVDRISIDVVKSIFQLLRQELDIKTRPGPRKKL